MGKILAFLFCATALSGASIEESGTGSTIRVERMNVPGGGELITYFSGSAGSPEAVPLVSILKDNLGDADERNDRLREVWVFASPEPSVWQRGAACVPFLFRQAVPGTRARTVPVPVLDLAAPARGTWKRVAGVILQGALFNPLGMAYRATSTAYRARTSEYHDLETWEALDVVSHPDAAASANAPQGEERNLIAGRLLLSNRLLGGMVADRDAGVAWSRDEARRARMRGHNWELLRQRAEETGLYFESVSLAGGQPEFAMLWTEQGAKASNRKFDAQFLGISDPFGDPRLASLPETTWWLDAEGSRVLPGTPDARPVKMVPLALYSLEYPRVPLLVIDFRNPGRAGRREFLHRAGDDITVGVLGLTGFANWPFLAAKGGWMFVRERHGAATNRQARQRAYMRIRDSLLMQDFPVEDLRDELARDVDRLDLNPLDVPVAQQPELARKQYAALVRMLDSGALARDLNKQRVQEVRQFRHSRVERAGLQILKISTAGIYRHKEAGGPELLATVDRERRFQYDRAYLERVLALGPHPEVTTDMSEVQRAVDELSRLGVGNQKYRQSATELITRVLARAGDQSLRAQCTSCLQLLGKNAD